MQELLFPETVHDPRDTFDEYEVIRLNQVSNDRYIVLFERVDTNAKHYYLVADRVRFAPYPERRWHLTNAKEFGHAENRANRYFDMRGEELANSQ